MPLFSLLEIIIQFESGTGALTNNTDLDVETDLWNLYLDPQHCTYCTYRYLLKISAVEYRYCKKTLIETLRHMPWYRTIYMCLRNTFNEQRFLLSLYGTYLLTYLGYRYRRYLVTY